MKELLGDFLLEVGRVILIFPISFGPILLRFLGVKLFTISSSGLFFSGLFLGAQEGSSSESWLKISSISSGSGSASTIFLFLFRLLFLF